MEYLDWISGLVSAQILMSFKEMITSNMKYKTEKYFASIKKHASKTSGQMEIIY